MANLDITDKLIQKIAEDDSKAFEALYQLYHKRLYAFVYSLVSSSYDTEEIVQNIFIAIWNQRHTLRITTSFLSYLFGIARHLIYDYIGRRLKHEAFVEFYLYNNSEYTYITEEEVIYNELRNKYETLLMEIPERRREIFLLSRNEGLSYKEIAIKLGITENTVDTQIRHALSFLRDRLLEPKGS